MFRRHTGGADRAGRTNEGHSISDGGPVRELLYLRAVWLLPVRLDWPAVDPIPRRGRAIRPEGPVEQRWEDLFASWESGTPSARSGTVWWSQRHGDDGFDHNARREWFGAIQPQWHHDRPDEIKRRYEVLEEWLSPKVGGVSRAIQVLPLSGFFAQLHGVNLVLSYRTFRDPGALESALTDIGTAGGFEA